MAGLKDIVSRREQVDCGDGIIIPVGELPLSAIAHMLAKFPEVGQLMMQKDVVVDIPRLMIAVPEAIELIVAHGVRTGEPIGDCILMVKDLGADLQLKLAEKILEITMPDGIGPFAEKIVRLISKTSGTQPEQDASVAQAVFAGIGREQASKSQ